jgi:hypothetical protein
VHLLLVLLEKGLVDGGGGWCESRCGNEFQSGIADKLSCQPEERFLEVVVGLSRDIVVLQILLSMESDSLSLNLSFLNVNLVAGEDDRDILADTDQVTVPVGDVLVGNARSNIKHDDTTLAVDVVPITKASELLLSCGIPDIELDVA